jgi:hypothetical protein
MKMRDDVKVQPVVVAVVVEAEGVHEMLGCLCMDFEDEKRDLRGPGYRVHLRQRVGVVVQRVKQ